MENALKTVLLVLLGFLGLTNARGQSLSWDQFMQEWTEANVTDEADAESWEAQAEELSYWHEHPLDINRASCSELLELPFLSKREAEAIVNYRDRHGALHSLGELRLIAALTLQQQEWLRLFVMIEAETSQPTQPQRSLPSNRQEVLTRLDIPLYERQGWPWAQGIANRLRYTGQWNHWDVGVRAEKDAGEPIFTRQQPLWDAWGAHVMLKDVSLGSRARLHTMIIGDFKASFGEGLVMNTGFRIGKQQGNLWRSSSLLRPHRSADESRYLRGVAASVELGSQWTLTALGSTRQLDATVQKDNTVRSINTSGLHRTDSERAHCGTLGSHAAALHAAWHHASWQAGASALFQHYDHLFRQDKQLYRQIYPEGYLFGATAVDYGFQGRHLAISGETAYSLARKSKGVATLNRLAWRPSAAWQFSAIQRFYGKNYFSPYALSFGESADVRNESGLCLMADAHGLGALDLHALLDYFYAPWPRYTMTRSSSGFEGVVQGTVHFSRLQTAQLRYAVKSKERSDRRTYSHRLRAGYSRRLGRDFTASTTAFLHYFTDAVLNSSSTGWALMPRLDYAPAQAPFSTTMSFLLFSTEDYNSRLYLYEPSLMQTFGMQMLYGKGERLVSTIRWQPSHAAARSRFQLQFKAGVTHYRDRSVISSGATQINSPWKPDLQLLLRLQLR